ncbi:hypothetical protein SAMN05216189_102721 [Pseudomonas delhiensis]|uniref:Response regulatory domain-containing protein n=1 Tax=Pseudomonas delhiensis TaxID=366289 RepID=A0A239L5L8_9PSED|nr:hypothetical protein [Pseudomonas delhiensis]SDK02679.1 hypothetical protein SAMN05216189_102721 [Pseudomonas delhiensis]SNT24979.1 hypothetical protein SAMN06295949_118124 [Pseudomonas delhiensis]
MLPLSRRTLVFCPHPGCLQQYGILLNRLEVYHLSLCVNLAEVDQALAGGQRYNLFIYDKFSLCEDDLATLLHLSRNPGIQQFLLVGSFSEAQRRELLDWAWRQHVPLLQVLERPFSLGQLRSVVASIVDYSEAEQGSFPGAHPLLPSEALPPRSATGMPQWPEHT